MSDHLEINNMLSDEQAGGKKNTYGTKEHLLLNKTILENFRSKTNKLEYSLDRLLEGL